MNTSSPKKKIVDVEKVLYNKNPKLLHLLPRFVVSYLKRIVHEDFVNDFMSRNGHKMGVEFAQAAIEEFNITVKLTGEENLPKDGRYLFTANHPLGGFDGLILICTLNKYFPGIKWLVNDILMNIENLKPVFLPINKHGGQSKESVKQSEQAMASDVQIGTFPAGLVSRKIRGRIIDLEWKKNFISKAIQHKRDVIPVYVSGRNSSFFYRLAGLRKFFGIKANIEMLYLADETFSHSNEVLVVSIGKPIPWQTFDKSKTMNQWAQFVKDQVYELEKYSLIAEKNIKTQQQVQ